MRTRCFLVSLLFVAVLARAQAHAQAPAPSKADVPAPSRADKAKADKLFREGRDASRKGEHARACALFAESQRLDPTTGTLLNLGDCSENLGKLWEARQYLLEALGRLKPTDDRVPPTREQLARIESRLPKLQLRPSPAFPANAQVQIDRTAVPRTDEPLVLPAGEHEVTVRFPSGEERTVRVTLEQGRTTELPLDAPAPTPPPPTASSSPAVLPAPLVLSAPSPPSSRRAVGYGLVGLGLAGFAVAAIAGFAVIPERQDQVDAHCGRAAGFADPKACDAAGADAATSGRRWAIALNAALVVGIGAAGIGTYVLLSAPTSPGAGGPAAGLTVGGRF